MRVNFIVIAILIAAISACSTRVEHAGTRAYDPAPDSININIASADQLERLPHIGRKTAEAIVEFRAANGPFRRIEHLMLIRGVSEGRFRELQPYLRAD